MIAMTEAFITEVKDGLRKKTLLVESEGNEFFY